MAADPASRSATSTIAGWRQPARESCSSPVPPALARARIRRPRRQSALGRLTPIENALIPSQSAVQAA